MKKTVPFNLFEEGQTIYFDIIRLAELEKLLGDSIINIVRKQDAGANFCIAGLTVGLQHHYVRTNTTAIAEMIDEYFEKGGTLEKLALPIVQAIFESGIFGKADPERKNPPKTENA